MRFGWISKIAAPVILAAVGIAGYLALPDQPRVLVAYFPQVKGMYVGDHVTVLGVPVGEVTEIRPQADKVRVKMEINPDQKLPADVRAAQVAGSLVSIRAIELGPVFNGGPTLPRASQSRYRELRFQSNGMRSRISWFD